MGVHDGGNAALSLPTPSGPYAFNAHTVRVVDLDGSPWFVAADVCRCLGLNLAGGTGNFLSPLHEDEKSKKRIMGMMGSAASLISESGLYKLVMRSDKPEARTFQDWVTRDVLPAIRKEGVYVAGEEKLKVKLHFTYSCARSAVPSFP